MIFVGILQHPLGFDGDFWDLKINSLQNSLQDPCESVKIIKESLMALGREFKAFVKNLENFNDLYYNYSYIVKQPIV